jgi:FixJ family two-component response regulator
LKNKQKNNRNHKEQPEPQVVEQPQPQVKEQIEEQPEPQAVEQPQPEVEEQAKEQPVPQVVEQPQPEVEEQAKEQPVPQVVEQPQLQIEPQTEVQDHELFEDVYRILIVDDESEVLNALRRTLLYAKEFKSEITGADSAEAALEVLEDMEFDLILSDYRMPGMTGTEFLNVVRDKYPNTTRIIVTGYSDIEIIKEAINKAEIHYYVEKPWDNENIRKIVYKALQRKTQRDSKSKEQSRDNIMNWLFSVYNDIKSQGLDLSFIDQNIEIAKNALAENDWERAMTYINHSVNIIVKFAEISFPKLTVNEIKNIQLPANKWSKIELEIHNSGNANAYDVQLLLVGDFKIKDIAQIPIIKVDETKNLTVNIYPEEKGTSPLEINMVWTKPFDSTEYSFEDILYVQVGDLVGKTKLKRRFGYHKGYIKMELNIINEDLWDIKDVELVLQYDDEKLVMSYIKPNYNLIEKKFKIGNINSHRGKNIEIFFDPLLCTDTVISGKVLYRDYNNKEKFLTVSPQKVKILCPKLLTEKTIASIELKELLKNEFKYNGNKVVNIPLGIDIESLNKLCKERIFKYNVRIIDELNQENPQIIETWYYGTTTDMKNKLVIKTRFDEDTNSFEIYIASSNNPAITGLLTDLVLNISHDLKEKGIIQQPLKQIENIALKEKMILTKRWLFYLQLEKLEKDLQNDLANDIKQRTRSIADKFENISRREIVGLTTRHSNTKVNKGQQGRLDHSW